MEMLPKGGMSTVYKARQISLDRLVAIKVLPPASGDNSFDVEKFMAEARITAHLKHPNIVQVYDFGKTDEGIYFLVMEYVSGYTVSSWIRRKNYLSEENSLLCGLSVATAMNYAWQKAGIVHCDIKPDNVIIDGDGTVKLADLGLARSVKAIAYGGRTDKDIILGTPNFISPEQSRGNDPLDCRADIYSLGAMLYHCMTGTMPFEGMPAMEVMDRQVTGQIRDPQDINPRISVWSASLIEKMMAKERKYRQQDWNEVVRDISNVRSEMMPQFVLPAEAVSTVKCSAMREARRPSAPLPDGLSGGPESPAGGVCALMRHMAGLFGNIKFALPVLLIALIAVWFVYDFFRSGRQAETEELKNSAGRPLETVRPAAIRRAKHDEWARDEMRRKERALKEAEELMAQLDGKAGAAADRERFEEAARVYEKYRGPYENETAAEREKKALSFRQKQAEAAEKRLEQDGLIKSQLQHIAEETAAIIAADDVNAAWERLPETAADLPAAAGRSEFKRLAAILAAARRPEQNILDSFKAQKNQTITISFAGGPTNLFIRDVRDGIVLAEKVTVTERGIIGIQKSFGVRDLALDEKFARLVAAGGEECALMSVMLAFEAGDCRSALANAAKTGTLLSGPLAAAVKKESERRAVLAVSFIARRAGLGEQDAASTPDVLLHALHGRRFSSRKNAELARNVSQFRSRFGFTDTALRYETVLQAFTNSDLRQDEPSAPRASDVQTVRSSGPSQPPSDVISQVSRKMQELNTGLRESEISFQTDNAGQVESVEVVSVCLRDIQPIENLTTLQKLVCAGMRQHLRPDMPLIAPLDDLSPLKGISLTELAANHTRVKDISALAPMPLIRLDLAHTRVNDLQPLAGKQLRILDISFSSVRDIKFLAGMPLTCLNISGTEISDLSALNGMPLARLFAGFSRVRDLSGLSSLRLTHLSIRNTSVSDLSALQQLPLEFLNISATRVRDISALSGLPLQRLEMCDCDIGDISALRDGVNLTYLDMHNTKVKDIGALDGMPLEFLNISRTGVKDISVLKNMPLKLLFLRETEIRDLTAIEDSGIEEIWIDGFPDRTNSERKRAIQAALYKMPRLRSVNGHPLWMLQKED